MSEQPPSTPLPYPGDTLVVDGNSRQGADILSTEAGIDTERLSSAEEDFETLSPEGQAEAVMGTLEEVGARGLHLDSHEPENVRAWNEIVDGRLQDMAGRVSPEAAELLGKETAAAQDKLRDTLQNPRATQAQIDQAHNRAVGTDQALVAFRGRMASTSEEKIRAFRAGTTAYADEQNAQRSAQSARGEGAASSESFIDPYTGKRITPAAYEAPSSARPATASEAAPPAEDKLAKEQFKELKRIIGEAGTSEFSSGGPRSQEKQQEVGAKLADIAGRLTPAAAKIFGREAAAAAHRFDSASTIVAATSEDHAFNLGTDQVVHPFFVRLARVNEDAASAYLDGVDEYTREHSAAGEARDVATDSGDTSEGRASDDDALSGTIVKSGAPTPSPASSPSAATSPTSSLRTAPATPPAAAPSRSSAAPRPAAPSNALRAPAPKTPDADASAADKRAEREPASFTDADIARLYQDVMGDDWRLAKGGAVAASVRLFNGRAENADQRLEDVRRIMGWAHARREGNGREVLTVQDAEKTFAAYEALTTNIKFAGRNPKNGEVMYTNLKGKPLTTGMVEELRRVVDVPALRKRLRSETALRNKIGAADKPADLLSTEWKDLRETWETVNGQAAHSYGVPEATILGWVKNRAVQQQQLLERLDTLSLREEKLAEREGRLSLFNKMVSHDEARWLYDNELQAAGNLAYDAEYRTSERKRAAEVARLRSDMAAAPAADRDAYEQWIREAEDTAALDAHEAAEKAQAIAIVRTSRANNKPDVLKRIYRNAEATARTI